MSRKIAIYSILILAAAAIDISLWSSFLSTAFTVSFSLILVIVFVLTMPFEHALVWSSAQGLLLDLISTHTVFGSYMIAIVVMVVVMTTLKKTWFKQTSVITVSLIATSGLFIVYGIGWTIHLVLLSLGMIPYNPFAVLTLFSIIVGILVQNIIINFIVRIFSVFQKFVLL